MRAELHAADLIDDEEYAWLCSHEFKEDKGRPGSPSPRRLEDYDELRKKLKDAATQHATLSARFEALTAQSSARVIELEREVHAVIARRDLANGPHDHDHL